MGNVLGEDSGSETVDGIVGHLDNLVDGLEFGNGDDRAEDFFLHNFHGALDISEDSRLDEVALVTDTAAAHVASSTFALAGLDVAHDTIVLGLRNLRTLEGGFIERIADASLGSVFLELGEELVVDTLCMKSQSEQLYKLSQRIDEKLTLPCT